MILGFRSLKVTHKLVLLALIPLLLLGSLIVFAMRDSNISHQRSSQLVEQRLQQLQAIDAIDHAITASTVDIAYKTRSGMMLWQETRESFKNSRKTIDSNWPLLPAASPDEVQGAQQFEDSDSVLRELNAILSKLSDIAAEESGYDLGNYIDLDLYTQLDPILHWLRQLNQQVYAASLKDLEENRSHLSARQSVLAIIFGVSVLVILAFSGLMLSAIRNPVAKLREALRKVGDEADLNVRVYIGNNDEFAEIAKDFNTMMAKIAALINKAKNVADALNATAHDLNSSSDEAREKARRTQRELSNAAVTAREMSESVNAIQGFCQTSAEAAQSADSHATTNFAVINESTEKVRSLSQAINESVQQIENLLGHSQQIGGMVEVIVSVAEQTNLLALNAAIEAARAGEQGRGFAVVADEVRGLAQRTQQSTASIEGVISQIQKATDNIASRIHNNAEFANNCAEIIAKSDQELSHIMQSFRNVHTQNEGILKNISEQAGSTERVAHSIGVIADIAEQSLQSLEKNAQLTRSVFELAGELKKEISSFQ